MAKTVQDSTTAMMEDELVLGIFLALNKGDNCVKVTV